MSLNGLTPQGLLTPEQSQRFIELVIDRSVLAEQARIHCLTCGVSWPYLDEDLRCTCTNVDWTPDIALPALPFVP